MMNIFVRFCAVDSDSYCLNLHLSSFCLQEESHSAVQHINRGSLIKPCDDSGKPFQGRFHGRPQRQTLYPSAVSTKPRSLALSLPYAPNGLTTHEYSYASQTQMLITYSRLGYREADFNVVLNCRTTIQFLIMPTGDNHI